MVRDYWTREEKLKLKELHIDPVSNSPERLKELVNYFRTPDSSLWAITEGHGPLHVSKSLGRKIRDYQAEGALDWLMDETPGSNQWFDPAWRGWLRSNPAEFSQAVDAYLQELGGQVLSAEIHLGFGPPSRRQGSPTAQCTRPSLSQFSAGTRNWRRFGRSSNQPSGRTTYPGQRF